MTLTPEQIKQTLASPRYSALARLNVDVATLATFDPSLVRDTRLLVPMDVRGLLVRSAGTTQAVPTATAIPAAPPGTPEAGVLPVPPAPFAPAFVRPAGVHLHWAMPDGLTRGNAGGARTENVPAGNPTGLPPLPDRWVVVRMSHGTSTQRAWIVESDRGEHRALQGWIEHGPPAQGVAAGGSGRRIIPRTALNAAAGGDLTWAATYDAVVDRFAFHDDLADIPAAQRAGLVLSYLVAGWWSEQSLDPLHDANTVGEYQELARQLGWLAPEPSRLIERSLTVAADAEQHAALGMYPSSPARAEARPRAQPGVTYRAAADGGGARLVAQGPAMPRATLLHGTLTGVKLDGGTDLAPAASSLEVAVGPSGFAALSALLADGTPAARIASERVLAAFASGLIATIDQPNGLVAVDDDRHAGSFVGFGGPHRAQPDRVAEGDIMNQPTTPLNATGETGGKRSSAREKEADLTVRLEKKRHGEVLEIANEKRTMADDDPSRAPRSYRDVAVPGPRSFLPSDVALVVRGAVRSLRHGGDGRFTPEGLLACRLPSQVVSGYQGLLADSELPGGLRSLGSGSIPSEIDLLLREAVLTDPYRWQELSAWAASARDIPRTPVENRLKAEMALRSVERPTRGERPRAGDEAGDVLRAASLLEGEDPSPVGVTRWAQPWIPMWCDWEVSLAVDDSLARWTLDEIDFEVVEGQDADAPATRLVRGRTLLTSAPSRALAAKIRQWLSEEDARDLAGLGELAEGEEADLAAAATAADGLDVLMGTFAGIRETLLGLDPLEASRVRIDASGAPTSKPLARSLPTLLAGGGAEITRLRIVDSFGRWLDVPAAKLAASEIAATIAHAKGAPHLLLRPRLQRPSRIAFRFIDPRTADGAPDVEARVDQERADGGVSPIAGWLMPDHVDEALEFFDSAGNALGQLMHDELTGFVVWEGAPGRQGPIGGPPDPGSDPAARHVTNLAAGLVAADAAARNAATPPTESALSALLRGIDTTLWTVDPLGSLGTSAVAGLVGRPIAVVRALLRLDVLDDLDALSYATPADRAARAQRYAELAVHELHVRLGSLTRTDDSVLAYAIDDDYSQLHLVAPEVRQDARVSGRLQGQLGGYGHGAEAAPAVGVIDHPYVSGATDVGIRPGQTIRLTLLMNPGGKAYATTGFLPRKSVALARDWSNAALTRLSPSFRVGPVLVDPTTIRLPMVTGLGENQTFTRRDTPQSWRDDPITAATQTAYLPEQPSELQEGWIRVVQQITQEGA